MSLLKTLLESQVQFKQIKEIIKKIKEQKDKDKVLYTVCFDIIISSQILESSDFFDVVVIGNKIPDCLYKKNITIVETDFYWDNPRKTSRVFKFLPHIFFSDYFCSLYFDANCEVNSQVIQLINDFIVNKNKLLLFSHNKRNCIYQEIDACQAYAKENPKKLQRWKKLLIENEYPKNNGLIQGGFIIRIHNDEQVNNLMDLWLYNYHFYINRDQLILNYIAWKEHISINYISRDIGTLHKSIFTSVIPQKATRINEEISISEKFKIIILNAYLTFRTLLRK